ncbi:MAG: undecaprenyl-phosphate galactose phosphotransferase WbaP [Treponema sp.]|nr:undecaprenyl-phosphate galactose phosphotransferase WbaP [Treponema sp.]
MSKKDLQESIRSRYKHTSSFMMGASLLFFDAAALMISIGIGFFIVNFVSPPSIYLRSFIKYAIFLPLIFIVFYSAGLYPGIFLAPEEEVKLFSICTFFSLMGAAISITTIKSTKDFIPIAIALVLAWPAATLLLPMGREVGRRFNSHFAFWGVPAIVYAAGDHYKEVVKRLITRRSSGYKPVLIITSDLIHPEEFMGVSIVSPSDEIYSIIKNLGIKVAINCGYKENLENIHTHYRYVIQIPRNQLTAYLSMKMKNFGGILGFSSTNNLTKLEALALKRFIDLFLCLLIAPLVVPVCIFIAIGIKCSSKGPVFYGHKRTGKRRKPLKCWKFRSMCIDAEEKLKEILANDPVRAAEWEKDRKFTDDPRVTKFGKFLRKTSLDELPQLWNIFTGEMSFVGPRPVTEGELSKYGKFADYILSVKPGLSGMWQISGRSDTGYEERINLDTYYIQNWSIWLDIWIIIKTVWVVLKGKGAY